MIGAQSINRDQDNVRLFSAGRKTFAGNALPCSESSRISRVCLPGLCKDRGR
jgi:hypothetical protein